MKKLSILIALITGVSFTSCEVSDFDLQENPNNLAPSSADPDLLLNAIQDLFEDSMSIFARNTDDVMRYEAMQDTYADIADPSALDGEWVEVYRLRENAKILEGIVEQDDRFRFHRGMAKILRAYATATMVDYFADVPFLEANAAGETLNPSVTQGADIYTSVLNDLDLAIEDLNNAEFTPTTDLYFGGDAEKWIKTANTIKFRMLLNMGDQARLNALLAQDNLIDSASDDFQFTYVAVATPESRHPYFQRSYLLDDPSEYIGNFFMWLLKDSKVVRDPRLRYYVYRQTNTDPTGTFLRCAGDPEFDFCYIGDFYWGRDHGQDDSRPPDGFLKAIYGLYPAGGAFDADNPAQGSASTNMGGAGIFPIVLSSYVKFLKAEASLSIGTTGDPAAFLEAGIRESMEKVLNFRDAAAGSSFAATSSDVDEYVTIVMDEYNGATDEGKLDIVMREYYLASYGNAIESYNGYRRTGFPSNLQIPIRNESIPFPRTYSLPDDAVNNNTSLSQRPITTQVFWDTNPAGFIK